MRVLNEKTLAISHLYELSSLIVGGGSLEECLELIYESFHSIIPYDRIGYADIDADQTIARARWARANDRVLLRCGYTAPLAGSSLYFVIERRVPRVIDDLEAYLSSRPNSRSTQLMVREGIRSSMTCPLFVDDRAVGLLFFSSRQVDTYGDTHIEIMKEIAMHLAMLLMTSAQIVESQDDFGPPEDQVRPQRDVGPRELPLSQLEAGMVLAASIRQHDNESLLLSRGTRLSKQAIARLIRLHNLGVIDVDSVTVE